MRWLRRKIEEAERGAALVWIAGSLVVLLTTAAFATDLGWILLWNSRLQAAADAAALAGVVNLPGFPGLAQTDAETAAGVNGFAVPADATLTPTVLADNQYHVRMDTEVDTFFLRLIGFDTFALSQESTAQYVKPVRLGSPDNTFGDPGSNFWAAINGRYTEIRQGDPYASECITHNSIGSGPGCQSFNPAYRPGGYYYAIEVGAGSSDLNIEFYDGGHYVNGSGNGTSNTGDRSWRWGWPAGQRGVYLEYFLYGPDSTPTDPTDNNVNAPLHCNDIFSVNDDTTPGHFNSYSGPNNCSVGGSLIPGIYVLQLPSPLYEGATKFGIRATVGTGPAPRIYGILDMSIYVNFNAGQAEPFLAEIREEHAGKVLEVDIWDLGDVDGTADIRFIDPLGGNVDPPSCSWTSTNGESATNIPDCIIDISNQRFNAEWLYVTIPLGDPVCNPALGTLECWWKLHINSSGQTHDRTTWAARVSGDPVRINQ